MSSFEKRIAHSLGMVLGVAVGVTLGVALGMVLGMALGVALGMVLGVALGVALGIGRGARCGTGHGTGYGNPAIPAFFFYKKAGLTIRATHYLVWCPVRKKSRLGTRPLTIKLPHHHIRYTQATHYLVAPSPYKVCHHTHTPH